MNLVIDIGNTRVKAAYFSKREMLEYRVFAKLSDLIHAEDFLRAADKVMVGTVVNINDDLKKALNHAETFMFFTNEAQIPLKNLYKTAGTLGSDRLAAAIGAHSLYPNKNVLNIDTGTCLKFNFVSQNMEYLGGAISPGLQMRFKALQHFTDKLPLVKMKPDFNTLIGNSTENSILSGVINGILKETDGIIEEYKLLYPDLTIVVSGGDTEFFAKRLKNRIFAHPHTVLVGLNEVLIYNS